MDLELNLNLKFVAQSTRGPDDTVLGRWKRMQARKPTLGQREGARRLGVTELELVGAQVGHGAIRLDEDWVALVRSIQSLGAVGTLTRNEHCAIQRDGEYRQLRGSGGAVHVDGGGLSLRLFLDRWYAAYAVEDVWARRSRRSIQIFDAEGRALHKVFLRSQSDGAAYERLIAAHAAADQDPGEVLEPRPAPEPESPGGHIDVAILRATWAQLRQPGDLGRWLEKYQLTHEQLLTMVGTDFAERVVTHAPAAVLRQVVERRIAIVVTVGNPGVIQSYEGTIVDFRTVDGWCSAVQDGFGLHLQQRGVASAWVVRRSSTSGMVTVLELFDRRGTLLIQLRSADDPPGEEGAWRSLLQGLSRLPSSRT